jgi:(p)ppGpp synthase/HD superfamily hydrolase
MESRCPHRPEFAGVSNYRRMTTKMPNVTVLTDRFDRALLYAFAATVLEYGGSEDMAIAALLHDAVEDQGGEPRLADIRNRFGDRVADIVHSCSDSTSANQPKEDWHVRKTRYIEHLKTLDEETLLVSLSDKVHNARSILRDLRKPEIGPAIWERFKKSKQDTLWYYRELAKAFGRLLKGQQLAKELGEIVKELEKA